MAKQTSIFTLKGSIGNATFLKTSDGYLVKEKSSITAQKIATDPAFARTRENMAEFARAGKAAKLLRNSFAGIISKSKDRRMVSRLTKKMMEVVKLDSTSTRGQRNVIDGEILLLKEFDFNIASNLKGTFKAPIAITVNRATGEVAVSIPAFEPEKMLLVPGGCTHFKIRLAAALIDFENSSAETKENETAYQEAINTPTAATDLTIQLTAASTQPLVVLLGIEFVQDVNAVKYPLQNGAFNCCSVIEVDDGL